MFFVFMEANIIDMLLPWLPSLLPWIPSIIVTILGFILGKVLYRIDETITLSIKKALQTNSEEIQKFHETIQKSKDTLRDEKDKFKDDFRKIHDQMREFSDVLKESKNNIQQEEHWESTVKLLQDIQEKLEAFSYKELLQKVEGLSTAHQELLQNVKNEIKSNEMDLNPILNRLEEKRNEKTKNEEMWGKEIFRLSGQLAEIQQEIQNFARTEAPQPPLFIEREAEAPEIEKESIEPVFVPLNEEEYDFLPVTFSLRRPPSSNHRKWLSAAFYNYKGGVGKTTLAFNIAHDIASRHKKRVLLIDVDPQSNLSLFTLGDLDKYRRVHWTVSRLFSSFNRGFEHSDSKNVQAWVTNSNFMPDLVQIIPNKASQMNIEEYLVQWYCNHKDLRQIWIDLFLHSHNLDYDYIIFDCPPNMGFMSQAALVASDAVFVPLTSSLHLIRDSVRNLKDGIAKWRAKLGEQEQVDNPITGFILNNFPWDGNAFSKNALEEIENYRGNYGEMLFPQVIPHVPKIAITKLGPPLSMGLQERSRGRVSIQVDTAIESLNSATDEFIRRLELQKNVPQANI